MKNKNQYALANSRQSICTNIVSCEITLVICQQFQIFKQNCFQFKCTQVGYISNNVCKILFESVKI